MEEKNTNPKIEIPLSKVKIGLLFLGSLAFVVLGIHFMLNPEYWMSSRTVPTFNMIIGVIATLFFGVFAFFIGRKLFDNQIGLIIDDRGITDNTNMTSVGLIEWRDIVGMHYIEIESTKIIILRIHNKKKYIARAKNGLARRAMKSNDKMYGSPISIISNSLKIKFKDLEHLLDTEMKKRDINTMKFWN